MHPTVKAIIDPRKPAGGFFAPWLVLIIAAVALIAFLAGAFAVQTYNAHFFRTHYRAPLRSPGIQQLAPRAHVGTLPAAASIHFQYFMTAINDQGDIGSCQSWSFSKQLSYAANWNRQANGKHLHHFLSPRFGYDLVSSGQDAGSYLEQYPPLARTVGVDRWIAFPYGDAARYVGFNPYAVDYPVPTVAFTAAHQINVTEHQLFPDQGAGMAGVDLIRQALSTHHMVNIDTIVPRQFDDANQTQGNVAYYPNQSSRGGHAIVAVAYDDTHVDPYSGQVGAVLISNQWTDNYGIAVPSVTGSNVGGFAWLSYSFIAHDVWDAAVVHVSTAPATPPPPRRTFPYVPSHAPLHKAPAFTSKPTHKIPTGSAPQVYNVYTTDTHVNLSNAINQASAHYGFSAPGFAALMGVESGIRQYAPHYPINGAGYCDYSGGLTQITVCTAAGLGIGNGTMTGSNIAYVFWYEQADAVRDVWLSARLVARMKANVCFDFPILYSAWNQGDGLGCGSSLYPYPQNWITQNAVAIYRGWWSWVWASHVHYADPTPPKPKPVWHFPTKRWCRYDRAHHVKCPSAYWKRDQLGKVPFTWAHWRHAFHRRGTIDHVCGGVRRREHWNKKLRMEKQRFAHCTAYSWPRYHNDPVKWVRLRHHPKAPAPAPTPGQPAPTAQPNPTPAPISGSPTSYWLTMLNSTRAQYGVAPLTLDAMQSAGSGSCVGSQGHSDAMAALDDPKQPIWHISPDPRYDYASFPKDVCGAYHFAGENVGLAGGDEDAAIATVHQLMMAEPHSPGCTGNHACNVLDPAFHRVGLGFTEKNGAWYLTSDFLS